MDREHISPVRLMECGRVAGNAANGLNRHKLRVGARFVKDVLMRTRDWETKVSRETKVSEPFLCPSPMATMIGSTGRRRSWASNRHFTREEGEEGSGPERRDQRSRHRSA